MPRYASFLSAVGLICLVSACQIGGPGQATLPDGVTPNAVTGDAIEVTALDAPPPAGAEPGAEPAPAAAEATAPPQADPTGAADPAAVPEPVAEPAPQPDLAEPVPEVEKSEQQRACEKKGGKWAKSGKGSFRICVYETKDANKQCTRESDCDGVCLARSGTCSPYKPLVGCNEILQDNGARVTLCIE